MNISHSVSSPSSPSVVEGHQVDDDATITDYSQSGDDISTPTAESVIAKWSFSKGHKRSRSNTMDYSHSSTTTATATHRRSSSFDVNLLVHEKTNKSTGNEIDSKSPLVTEKRDKQQQQEQQQQQPPQEQQQAHVTTSDHLFQDDVDFSSMFGKWKGMQVLINIKIANYLYLPVRNYGMLVSVTKPEDNYRIESYFCLVYIFAVRLKRQSKFH